MRRKWGRPVFPRLWDGENRLIRMEAISAARTRYLPVLSSQAHAGQLLRPVEVDFRQGALGTLPGVGPVPNRDVTVKSSQDLTAGLATTLTQPVTQLYTASQGVHLAETGREADRAQLQAERAAVVTDVKRLYHRLVATQALFAAMTGSALGIFMADAAARWIMSVRPQFLISFELMDSIWALLAGIGMALIACIFPTVFMVLFGPIVFAFMFGNVGG